ncbi:serine/threonine-protein kinase pim-2-like isoform X3 [Trichomycterus rosablanca]|uniref:serine/threonine-protein kinase pim-2-like isoform X3 n=1 Tax=Trichomycterus rosablanca TaxID=2290929 RepID=UPI002F352E5E
MAEKQKRRENQRASLMQRFFCWPVCLTRSRTSSQDDLNEDSRQKYDVDRESRVVMEGFLFKRASNVFKTWNRRWFMIKDNQLIYKSKSKREATVLIEDVRLCRIEHCENIRHSFHFQLVSPTKRCFLKADSEEIGQAWMKVIQHIITKPDDANRSDSSETLDRKSSLSAVSSESDQHQKASEASASVAEISLGEVIFECAAELNDSDASVESGGKYSTYSFSGVCSVGAEEEILSDEESPEDPTTSVHFFNNLNHEESFDCCYTVGELLGEGGCGVVYAGVCNADGKQVAVKYVLKDPRDIFITIPGETYPLPAEVALMKMVSKPPHCNSVLKLLDWFDTPEHYILILERPIPCMDLFDFIQQFPMNEAVAQLIMWQVVLAAIHCHDCGVFHRDIKPENLLVNTETLEVKLIDFGCGDLHKETAYTSFSGTKSYAPPEWIVEKEMYSWPATVWSLGVLLHTIVCGEMPFGLHEVEIVDGGLDFLPELSDTCYHLISRCLEKQPEKRLSLKEILQHEWFTENSMRHLRG